MSVPLITRGRVKEISFNMAVQLQDKKIEVSKAKIAQARSRKIFPEEDEGIVSYVISRNPRNRSADLQDFYVRMRKSPKLATKKFIHDAFGGADILERIAEATRYAEKLMDAQYAKYPEYKSRFYKPTYELRNSQWITVDGNFAHSNYTSLIKNYKGEGRPVVELTNIAAYASTAEAHALYVRRIGGIIFWVAHRVQTRFSDLGIRFEYAKASDFNLKHKYDVPILRITSPEQITERGRWSKPGENRRRRERFASRVRRRTNRYNRTVGGGS